MVSVWSGNNLLVELADPPQAVAFRNQEARTVLQLSECNGGEQGTQGMREMLNTAHLYMVQIPSWKEKLQLFGTQNISETLLGTL